MSKWNLESPRISAIDSMKASITEKEWKRNSDFTAELKEKIQSHPIVNHKIIDLLSSGKVKNSELKKIHLEYRHAIVQIFTDALLMAQFKAETLEPRLKSGSKMAPRFLLALNVLDEFGFQPSSSSGYYEGNNENAHYNLFEAVLDSMGISNDERLKYKPSTISIKLREFLEHSYSDYVSVLALLAVAETQVIVFSPPLRQAVSLTGQDSTSGYYKMHGTTYDGDSDGSDDDHEDDLWVSLIQACLPTDYEKLTDLCMKYCDLWDEFWSHQYNDSTSKELNGLIGQ
jgi:hypothetical protein